MGGESQSHPLLFPSSLFSFMAQSETHAYTYLPHAVAASVPLHQKTAHTHTHTHLHIGTNTVFLLLSNFLINTDPPPLHLFLSLSFTLGFWSSLFRVCLVSQTHAHTQLCFQTHMQLPCHPLGERQRERECEGGREEGEEEEEGEQT